MIYEVEQNSTAHRSWQKIRDRLLGGLQYSWARTIDGQLLISFSEDLTKDIHTGYEITTSGISVTKGTKDTASNITSIIGHTALKQILNNVFRRKRGDKPEFQEWTMLPMGALMLAMGVVQFLTSRPLGPPFGF